MFETLPGGDLLAQGLADLDRGHISVASLLLLIASPRLRRGGFAVPEHRSGQPWAEDLLYDKLVKENGANAYRMYNALLDTLVSLENALDVSR